MLTNQELQSLRNLGNEAEDAADEIARLRQQNLDVAFLILRNDRVEAVRWAKGLLLTEGLEVCVEA